VSAAFVKRIETPASLKEKLERLDKGAKPNPFIDAAAFKTFIEQAERKFLTQLESERKNATASKSLGN
jgi:hypothetical protein